MNRLTIMGASIVLLLAAFVLTPAEAYHKRHQQHHTPNLTARPRIISFSTSPNGLPATSASTPPGGLPAIAPPKIAL